MQNNVRKLILVVLFLSSLINSTTVSTISDGNYNSYSIWSSGSVPSDTDDVIINHTVTANVVITKQGSNSNLCSLTINGKLILSAQLNMNQYSALIVTAGGEIDLSGNDINGMSNSSFRRIDVTGTPTNRSKIYNSTGNGRIYYADGNGNGSETTICINHCDFKSMGDINLNPWNANDSVIIYHSTFTNCKRLYIGRWKTSAVIRICNTDFYNSRDNANGKTLEIGWGENLISPDILIDHCTFYHSSGAVVFSDLSGITIKNSIFRNVNVLFLTNGFEFTNNAMLQSNCYDNSKLFGEVTRGKISNNYLWSDRDNPHWLIDPSGSIDSNIIESTYALGGFGDAGDFTISLETDTLWIKNNIFIDRASGSFVNQVGGISSGSIYVHNNTYFGNLSRPVPPPFYGIIRNEAGGKFNGYVSVINNIFCNRSGTSNNAGINLETSGADQIDYVDYNAFYNVNDKYYNVIITGKSEGLAGFGGSDIDTDPQFGDTTRNLANWHNDAINILLKINGYDHSLATQGPASGYSPIDLIQYVRAGFAPKNAALANGKDGATIGAVNIYTESKKSMPDKTPQSPRGYGYGKRY